MGEWRKVDEAIDVLFPPAFAQPKVSPPTHPPTHPPHHTPPVHSVI